MDPELQFLRPDWPAPPSVRAVVSTRAGGVSRGHWAGLNLADHVGDDPDAVAENRRRLRAALALPAEPFWLTQVHGTVVAVAGGAERPPADAGITREPGRVCATLTADCLPVLFASRSGDRVGIAHAGWRGLADGVVEATVRSLGGDPTELLAWLGPAIGPQSFEVGPDVRDAFLAVAASAAAHCRPTAPDRWLVDLYGIARQRLAACGVTAVFGGGLCTYRDGARFYSFRRDATTGRMASLIWLLPPSAAGG
ncbi:MAG: peptidoglycan editing factor PgeF [Gammaproteobacteria bacterium]|nr:peptidoglycan editing factor PgeF [Gammaproteobacteria bacterium]